MYQIRKLPNGYECSVQIQDGCEKWIEQYREWAIHSVIRAARSLNGTYIREDDIDFLDEKPDTCKSQQESCLLLEAIERGEKVVLDHTDPRVKYRITPEECEILIKIREGYLAVWPAPLKI